MIKASLIEPNASSTLQPASVYPVMFEEKHVIVLIYPTSNS